MKKSLLAAAILASVSGAASAATSVTLYGIVDVGYTAGSVKDSTGSYKTSITTAAAATTVAARSASIAINSVTSPSLGAVAAYGVAPFSTKTTGKITQRDGYHDDSRLGVKGQEDLGNGLSAIFKAEMRFAADTGILSTQLDQSYVGLKGSFGEVTVGRRLTITDDLFGYSSAAKELDGTGLGTVFNNNLSYRGAFGGLTVGADISTGENINGYTTAAGAAGVAGYKTTGGRAYQYAAGAEYDFGPGAVALGYEHTAAGKNAYGLGLKYAVGPVEMFGRVVRTTQKANNYFLGGTANMDKSIKGTGFAVGMNYTITPNDVLGVSYSQLNNKSNETSHAALVRTNARITTDVSEKSRMLSLDYTHSLSKRTSVYAGASLARVKTAATAVSYDLAGAANGAFVLPSYTSKKVAVYTVGLQHKF